MTENNQQQAEHVEVAPVEINAIEVMERASVDVQIATAHRFPRDIDKFIDQAKKMVAVDEETAASCIYCRPVGKDDDSSGQKYVKGESIRLAEIVASSYGNLRVGVIISEMTPRYVKAIGYAHDLESNFAAKAETVESTVTKWGKPYSERMRLVTAKAAQSKAMRDAIFRVVPKSLCKPITEKARQIILGKQKPLGERREAVKAWMSKLNIEPERILAALRVDGLNDIGDDELETLTGIRTALKDGEITLEEAFPPLNFKEKENESQKAIQQDMGSEKVDTDFGEDSKQAQKPPKPETRKGKGGRPRKSNKTQTEIPKFRYVCEVCGAGFDEPRMVGAEKNARACPACASLRVIDNPELTPAMQE